MNVKAIAAKTHHPTHDELLRRVKVLREVVASYVIADHGYEPLRAASVLCCDGIWDAFRLPAEVPTTVCVCERCGKVWAVLSPEAVEP